MKEWMILLPEMILLLTLIGVLVAGLIFLHLKRRFLPALVLLGSVLAFVALGMVPTGSFGQVFIQDGLARFFKSIMLLATILVVLYAWDFDYLGKRPLHEFLLLLLSSTLGMWFVASSQELILLYVGLELTTFPLVLLTAYQPAEVKSAEGGLKYMVMAALGSAILLFGFSFIYAATGTTNFAQLAQVLATQGVGPMVLVGVLCALAGIGFKLALVPFHMWAPDAYEGAPTAVTAFLSVAGKTAGFALALRFLASALPAVRPEWSMVLAVLAAASMLLGNFAAIPQTNLKRMLAYSSIAQAGYMTMGLVAFDRLGLSALLYYLAAYLFMNLCAFVVVLAVERICGTTEILDQQGMAQKHPRLALALLLSLLSLAGIPPLAGFTAKFYLFAAVYSQGYLWLVVLAVFNSALSLYYYLRVLRVVYILPPLGKWPAKASVPIPLSLVLWITLLGIFFLGVYPRPIVDWAQAVVAAVL